MACHHHATAVAPMAAAPMPRTTMPPPGLEDELGPAQISMHCGGAPFVSPLAGLAPPSLSPEECATHGQWVRAVMAVTPYLDAAGAQQALRILDAAVENIDRARAFDLIVSTAAGLEDPSLAPASASAAADAVRAQLREQQQRLLEQLRRLRVDAIAQLAQPPLQGPGAAAGCGALVQMEQHFPQHPGVDGRISKGRVSFAAVSPAMVTPLSQQQQQQQHHHHHQQHRFFAAEDCDDGSAIDRWGPIDRFGAMSGGPPGARVFQAPSGQKQGTARQQKGRPAQTLSTSLQMLADEDPDCLLIVRRINKLGFKAGRKLKQHFLTFGGVVKVLVAHSTVRQHGDPSCGARRRPSSLGFIHMAHPGAVRMILAQGDEQEIDGALIRVQKFERPAGDQLDAQPGADGAEDEEEDDDVIFERDMSCRVEDWVRQQSNFSTISTRTSASTAPSSLGEVESFMLETGRTWSF